MLVDLSIPLNFLTSVCDPASSEAQSVHIMRKESNLVSFLFLFALVSRHLTAFNGMLTISCLVYAPAAASPMEI